MDRAAEAEAHIKTARKASKGSFFKKPDWDVAALEWDNAAALFIVLKQNERAAECYQEAYEAHHKAGNLFFAGRALENLARLHQDKQELCKAAVWLEKAAETYGEDGKADKKAATLTKAARLLQDSDPDRALQLLEGAVAIYVEEEKWHLCQDAFRHLVSTYLKHGRWAEAVAAIEKKMPGFVKLDQPHNIHKAYAEIIVIRLAAKDAVAAEKAFNAAMQTPGFGASDEATVCETLLAAYNDGDEEALAVCAKDQTFTFLTTEVARLVRTLQPSGVRKAPAAGGAPAAARTPADPLAPTADTDELRDDDLC
eukprot:EG_transcript_14482